MKAATALVIRGLIVDAVFIAGLSLYGVGLWRSFPEYAPLVMGVTLMVLGAAAHLSRRSSNAS